MEKRRVLIAGLAALIAVLLIFMYVENIKETERRKRSQTLERISVLVAKEDIEKFTVLDNEYVEKKEIPPLYLPDDHESIVLKNPAEVLDRETAILISKGEIITKNKFLQEETSGDRLDKLILPGKRAVTIPVDALSNFNGLLRPGDKVDLIVTTGKGADRQTFPFLQMAEIIATGPYLKSEKESGNKSKGRYSTVTFCLSPDEAQQLVFLQTAGVNLRFIMRSNSDQETISTTPIKGSGIIER